jgi:hypothetical protein
VDEVDEVWLRLDRVGNTITGSYWSWPGGEHPAHPPEVWMASVSHEVEFPFPDGLIPGLATTSHEQGVPIEVAYSNFSIGPYAGPARLVDPMLPASPPGSEGYIAIQEVLDNGPIGDQGACFASLNSGEGSMAGHWKPVLNIQDSGGNGHFGNDDVFAVVDMGYRERGSVDDLSLITRGCIRIPPDQGGFWTFGVNSDDGFTLQFPGQNFLIGENGRIVNFENGEALQFYGTRPAADTFGLIELPPGDYPFWLTYHEGGGEASVEFFAVKGAHTSFGPDPDTGISRLVGHKSIGSFPVPGFCDEVTMAASLPGAWGEIDSVQDAMEVVAEGEAFGTNSIRGCVVVNHSDPEDGAADPDLSGSFGADLVFPNDRPGDDDDFAVMVEGLLDIPAAGTYQIGFNSDDGAGFQIFGHQWKSIVPGSDATAVIAGDVGDWLITDALTGWSWTAGEIEFPAPGCYEFRAIMFERGGGSFFELFGRGISPESGKPDPTWRLLRAGGAGMMRDSDGLQLVAQPIAYWKFDEGEGSIARDCSGYDHHGTLVGDVQWADGPPGLGGAVWESGGGHVSIGPDDSAQIAEAISNTGRITLMAWVMMPLEPDNGVREWDIIRKGPDGLALYGWPGGVEYGFRVGPDPDQFVEAAFEIPRETRDNWQHVAGVYDGESLYLYVNGELVASEPYAGPIAENDSVWMHGEATADSTRMGKEEVRIYNQALSQSEIEEIAALGGLINCFPDYHEDYPEWVAAGKPDCWCDPRQCRGDTDRMSQGKKKYWVGSNDLDVLIAAWNKPFAEIEGRDFNGTALICADFDHKAAGKKKYRVSSDDLDILIANWNQANAPAADCP